MSGEVTDLWGNKKEEHLCEPRSRFTKAFGVQIIAIQPGVWNIMIQDSGLPCGIAIKFCPFCGKQL